MTQSARLTEAEALDAIGMKSRTALLNLVKVGRMTAPGQDGLFDRATLLAEAEAIGDPRALASAAADALRDVMIAEMAPQAPEFEPDAEPPINAKALLEQWVHYIRDPRFKGMQLSIQGRCIDAARELLAEIVAGRIDKGVVAETLLKAANRAGLKNAAETIYPELGLEVQLPSERGRKRDTRLAVLPDAPVGDDRRQVVRIQPSRMHEAVDRAEEILKGDGKGPLFVAGGRIVHIVNKSARRFDGLIEEQPAIEYSDESVVLRCIEQRARCEKWNIRKDDWVPCDPPERMATQLLKLPESKLEILSRMINSPLIRADGSLLSNPGFDKQTGLYLAGSLNVDVPAKPTEDDAHRALESLTELFDGYPLVDDEGYEGVSLAVMISGLLTVIQRPVLDHAPAYGVSAPKAGTGKSHCVDLVAIISTGSKADCIVADPKDPVEFQKVIGAKLAQGRGMFCFDNVLEGHPLQGSFLCMLSTQDQVEHRVLGLGLMAKVSTCTVPWATGNNLAIRGDLTRRWFMARMDAMMELPEHRAFAHDVCEEAMRRRPEMVSKALTIIRWGMTLETPDPGQPVAGALPYAGYARWCRMIRDPMVRLGMADPVRSLSESRGTDDQDEGLATLLETWRETFQEKPMTVREVYDLIDRRKMLTDVVEIDRLVRLGDAINSVTGDVDLKKPKKLGDYLKNFKERLCNSMSFQRGNMVRGNRKWFVQEATSKA